MENEEYQVDAPDGYKNAITWTSTPLTDKELDDAETKINPDDALHLAHESSHKLDKWSDIATSKLAQQ